MLLRHARYLVRDRRSGNFTRGEVLHVLQPTLSQQIRQLEDTLRAPLLELWPSSSRSNLRCLSGPPCRCSARGRTGQLPREPSSRSRSRRTGTRERHGVTPAFALISRPVTPLFLGFRCELAAPLQRDRPARIAWLQTARTGGVHARIHRVAGLASSTGPPATRAQPPALN